MIESRPVLDLSITPADRLLDVLAAVTLLALLLLPAYWYEWLPERIPHHFDALGQADRWGSKAGIWVLPALGVGLYLLLTLLNRAPHRFNYISRITPENAAYQYRNATTMIRVLRLLILSVFLYITWSSISIAQGADSRSVGRGILLLVLLIEAAAIFFVARSWRRR
ncbi:MAG TPA: DUF1648 domain-containing protein [Saprospiraceae bacterium]|nr:DUF1648 domain-containing protein [Saprospiraceae bacterium]HND90093.1 DUF1648 domain-containing protein [Saprospiraceae bacterium]HNG89298.1 DUF1648 domain-containing protein [Saprospiraceae bacterium]